MLTGTLNDLEGVERSGRLRSINRRRWQREELDLLLDSPSTPTRDVFAALTRLLEARRGEPCFHPDAPQRVLETLPSLLVFERGPLDDGRRLLAVHNVTDTPQPLPLDALAGEPWHERVTGAPWTPGDSLPPYGALWLVNRPLD